MSTDTEIICPKCNKTAIFTDDYTNGITVISCSYCNFREEKNNNHNNESTDLFKSDYDQMPHNQRLTYILYISQLLNNDKKFKKNLDTLIVNSFKKGIKIPKKVTLSDFTEEELADFLNPIE